MADKTEQKHGFSTPVLMILCGIPASGKTHLANSIKEWSRRNREDEIHVLHICYDDLIPPNLNLKALSLNDPKMESGNSHSIAGNSAWKHYRKLIMQCAERIVHQIQAITLELNEEHDTSKYSRKLPSFEDFWKIFHERMARKDMSCACFGTQKWVQACHVLLVDDNMYYHSMRHEYFLIARKYGLGYMQVHMKCSIDTALKRNSQRSSPVDTSTLVTMATKLEPPSADKYPWEMYTMELDGNDVEANSYLTKLSSLIAKVATNPVQPLPEENQQEKEEAQAATLASTIHQADQTLRRIITEKMAKAKGDGFTKQEMKTLAEELNSRRKALLDKLKSEEPFSFLPPDDTVTLDRKFINRFASLEVNTSLNKTVFLVKHDKLITQLQSREEFYETIKILFDYSEY